jgi:hypothetical protein
MSWAMATALSTIRTSREEREGGKEVESCRAENSEAVP